MKCVEAIFWFTTWIQIKLLIIPDHYWITLNPALQGFYRTHASVSLFWLYLQDPNTKFHSCAFFQEAGTGKAGKEVFHHRFHKTTIQIQHTTNHGSFLSDVKKAIWNIYAMAYSQKKKDQRDQTPCQF